MRIVHLINSLDTGGAENLVVNLATAMQQAGNDVRIVTIGRGQGVPAALAAERGISVRALARSSRDPRSIFRVRAAVKGADVVHVHLFPSLYLGALAHRKSVLVYTEHSTWNRRRNRRLFRIADRASYRRYDAIVSISEGVRQALEKYLRAINVKAIMSVIPNGIDDSFFDGPESTAEPAGRNLRLIAIGTLDTRKNFADAIDAVASVSGVTLTIVGDGPLRSSLEKRVIEHNIGDRVAILGRRSDVKALLLEHDALLATSRIEGFSLVAAEALALGRPVIGPAIAGFSESVRDGATGLLYKPQDGSVASIIDKIRLLNSDPVLYEDLSQRAREDASRFRIAAAARAHLALYLRLGASRQ